MSSAPLLSVVIPTHKRPQFLPRAIDSALQAAPDGDVEVIVVPNGPDESWKTVAEHYRNNPQIRWEPIAKAHANAARNHGKNLATGKYVRFLDDDDYLLPPAIDQLQALERSHGEICSGRVLCVDMEGNDLGPCSFPETNDFIIACTQISGFTLPVGNVFLREAVLPVSWDESVSRLQDNVWMLDLASHREWQWVHVEKIVGVWFQHDNGHISSVRPHLESPVYGVDAIKRLFHALFSSGRINDVRRLAIARSLWNYVHFYFPYRPFYCTDVAKAADAIDSTFKPIHQEFSIWPFRTLRPLTYEWVVFPARKLAAISRNLKNEMNGWDYRRRI